MFLKTNTKPHPIQFRFLKHDRRLNQSLPVLPAQSDRYPISSDGCDVVAYSFRRWAGVPLRPKIVNGTTRFLDPLPARVVCDHLGDDSPLAPAIFWDMAHSLPVRGVLWVIEDSDLPCYLERAYYQSSFKVETQGKGIKSFVKVKPLPVERGRGLSRWTFGIPVGPEESTFLNAAVARILEIDVPEKEILLCGRPGPGFRFFDRVRVVGEDIPAPPIRIAQKKNRLVQEAQHENVCLLHDRVFLPKDFGPAVQKFGDLFPIVGFQSLFFEDHWNMVPTRYSDFMQVHRSPHWSGNSRTNQMSRYADHLFPLFKNRDFSYANGLRYSQNRFCTGSLYIFKKALWEDCPQDESLYWGEYEDVEHGERASARGIPERINPFSLTQSLIARPLLFHFRMVASEQPNGTIKNRRGIRCVLPISRKPLLNLSSEDARHRLRLFSAKYLSPESNLAVNPLINKVSSSWSRLRAILAIVNLVSLFRSKENVENFLIAVEKDLLLDRLPPWNFLREAEKIVGNKPLWRSKLISSNPFFLNQIALRPWGTPFMRSSKDFFVKNSVWGLWGSMISAFAFWVQNGKDIYLSGGLRSIFRSIRNSTPFQEYYFP